VRKRLGVDVPFTRRWNQASGPTFVRERQVSSGITGEFLYGKTRFRPDPGEFTRLERRSVMRGITARGNERLMRIRFASARK
jgi:hypothetical protein